MKKYKLYALTEPDDINDIKYIGVTKHHLLVRLGQHLGKMMERKTRRDEWLLTLKKAPLIILLDSFETRKEALINESLKINSLESNGVIILNEAKNFNRRFKDEINVYQYDLKGNFVKEYKSARHAANVNMFFNYKCINACCNGKKRTHYGFMFSFEKKDKILSFKRKKSVQGKIVYQYDLNNNLLAEFENGPAAQKALGILSGDIWKVCNNYKNQKTAGGFKWSYDKV